MSIIKDSRWIINTSISVLALFVFGLSGSTTWRSYQNQVSAARLVHINHLADKIVHVAGIQAMERGISALALGSVRSNTPVARDKILQLRRQGNPEWREVEDMVREIISDRPGDSVFASAFQRTQQDYQALIQARARVDASMGPGKAAIASEEWIDTMSRFIDSAVRLREAGFLSVDSSREVVQLNIIVKQQAWLMSEYAGVERATLAFFVGAGLPVPDTVMDHLKSIRGVVEHAAKVFKDVKIQAGTDPRIDAAVEGMEGNFLGRFQRIRQQVYAGAASGRYPVNGEAWMTSATDAIDSILGVVSAASQVIDEKAKAAAQGSLRSMVLSMVLFGVTLMITGFGIAKVVNTSDALFHEKELAEVTLHSIGDAVITTDDKANVEYMNPIAEEMTGWQLAEVRGKSLRQVFNIVNGTTREPQANPVEICLHEGHVVGLETNTILIARNGIDLIVEDSAAPVRDREGKIVGAVLVFYDASKSRNMPHLLSYQATHDALTGLVNRREFERHLNELLQNARSSGQHHALCYIDLDMFKIVNDTCGHAAGDNLLRMLSQSLKKRLRDADMLARLGGDEFGVLLEACPLTVAERIANDLRLIVKDFRFSWQGKMFEASASIGLVAITPESVSSAELLSEADAACYAAKDNGRNCVQVYQPENIELTRRHGEMQWVSRLNQALEENRFCLYQQTIIALSPSVANDLCCEILVRMLDEQGNVIEPGRFIPAAERYNLMPSIDRWVIRNALEQIGKTQGESGDSVSLIYTINLSGASFADESFLDFVHEQFDLYQVKHTSVCFEVTETAVVANLDKAVDFIDALRKTGCRFALDDFGTGLSSFVYLKALPVDYLKIAGPFVARMDKDRVDCAMVDTINRVAHVMGMKTIAEFVENDAILEKLRELGVDYAQGYGIARPVPMTDAPHGRRD